MNIVAPEPIDPWLYPTQFSELVFRSKDTDPVFAIRYSNVSESSVNFIVYSVSVNDDAGFIGGELWVDVLIKWDGCSHFNFGNDGYLHLCGAYYFELWCELMRWLYHRAFEKMGREPDEKWIVGNTPLTFVEATGTIYLDKKEE